MKKLYKIIGIMISLCLIFSMTACSDSSKLETPTGLMPDENNYLRWNVVPGAKNYDISIDDGKETEVKTLKTNGYSLDLLPEGEYVIKVKAIGNGSLKDSDWATCYFTSYNSTGLVYRLTDNGSAYEITGVGRADGEIRVEEKFRGKPVTKIGEGAFKNSSKITGVTIGENITSIGDNAFYNCAKLEKVVLPQSLLDMGVAAFQSCASLAEISIPANLAEIPQNAFAYCKKLAKVDFSNAVSLEEIGTTAFARCESLEELKFYAPLARIGANAFAYAAALKKVEFAGSIETIGNTAFMNATSLETVTFEKNSSLKELGTGAFVNNTSLTKVELPEGLENVSSQCFANCTSLETIKLPSTITGIGTNAFAKTAAYLKAAENSKDFVFIDNWLIGCVDEYKENTTVINADAFSEYETKNSLKVVGIADSVFAAMPLLKEVYLPENVVYLGESVFNGCKGLNSFSAKSDNGHSLKVVGKGAFLFCEKLSDVQFDKNGSLENIGAYAFYGCSALRQKTNTPTRGMLVPTTVKRIGEFAFKDTGIWSAAKSDDMVYVDNWVVGWNMQVGAEYEQIEDMTDEEVAAIADEKTRTNVENTRAYLKTLWESSPNSITIKEGTVGIADYAFYHMYTQSIIGVDGTVEDTGEPIILGEGAFYRCQKLDSISLNSKMTSLPGYTFYKCGNLTEITLPRSLAEIGRSAFYNCERLSSINFTTTPNLKTIDEYAFYGCVNLKNPTFHITGRDGSIETIGDYAFYGCKNVLTVADLPNSLVTLGNYAFANCSALNKIVYGTGIKNIPDYAFYNCTALDEIDIPDTILSVGEGAYLNCSASTKLTIGQNVEKIGNYAFSGLSITSVVLPGKLIEIGSYAFRNTTGLTSVVIPSTLTKLGSHFAFGNDNVTFYLQSSSVPSGWNEKWNSLFRPVVYGCTLDETNTYVVSVEVTSGTFENGLSSNGFASPLRNGYVFKGWAKTEGGSTYLSAAEINSANVGETLYAVWE